MTTNTSNLDDSLTKGGDMSEQSSLDSHGGETG